MKHISNLFIFKDDLFFQWEDNELKKVSEDIFHNLSSFDILVDDNYFFYESLEMPRMARKKQKSIIKNSLMVSYPEDIISEFDFIVMGDHILIYIISSQLREIFENYKNIFKKAGKISTPFIEFAKLRKEFCYSSGNRSYKFNNGVISSVIEDVGECLALDNVLSEINGVYNNLSLSINKADQDLIKQFRIPAIIIIVAYLFFFTGEFLRLGLLSKHFKNYDSVLNALYEESGVSNSLDPYGMLLSKAKSGEQTDKIYMMKILESLSTSNVKDITIDSMSIKGKSVRLDGFTPDYTILESFSKAIKEKNNKPVTILNTRKEDENIIFSLRLEI